MVSSSNSTFVVNTALGDESAALLTRAIGSRIISLDAAIVASDNIAWSVVRVFFDSFVVDVRCDLENRTISEDSETEEYGVLSAALAPDEPLVVNGTSARTMTCPVEAVVKDVLFLDGTVDAFWDGDQVNSRAFTQAIAFKLGEFDWLVLDKETWFGDMIAVNRGERLCELARDSSVDWDDDPDLPEQHFVYSASWNRR